MCHCTNEIYYSNGLTQSQCHKKIPLAGLMDSAVSTAMDPACQRRVNARPAADNRSSCLYISRYLCYHNFVLYYILYYTIISCALAHMESKVETVSFCFDIIPQFRAPWRTWNQKSKQCPSVSILYHEPWGGTSFNGSWNAWFSKHPKGYLCEEENYGRNHEGI